MVSRTSVSCSRHMLWSLLVFPPEGQWGAGLLIRGLGVYPLQSWVTFLLYKL